MSYKLGNNSGTYILGYHIAILVAMPFVTLPTMPILIIMAILATISMIAVTAGYHRLFAHTTYKTNKFIEALMLLGGTLSMQGSALRWAYEHRIHHQYTDTEKDPYSIKKGFWHAHLLWMFEPNKEIKMEQIPDLTANKLVMFQHKHHISLMVLMNLAITLIAGHYFGYLMSFFYIWGIRQFLVHHFTFSINSFAHTIGSKPYSQEQSAVDNWLFAILTFGEGYHNYHHAFPTDYRNGVKWHHFDPSKWLIFGLSKIGLTRELKKISQYTIQRKILLQEKTTLLQKLTNNYNDAKHNIQEKVHEKMHEASIKIHEISDRLNATLLRANELMRAYKERKEQHILEELKQLENKLQQDWKQWTQVRLIVVSYKL